MKGYKTTSAYENHNKCIILFVIHMNAYNNYSRFNFILDFHD